MPNRTISALLALLLILSQTHLFVMLATLEPNILALQFAFTPDAFNWVLLQWGDAGMQTFRDHLPFDFVHVCLYAVCGYWWASRLPLFAGLQAWLARFALWALPAAAVLDAAENVLELYLIGQPAGCRDAMLVALAASCASLKWLLIGAFALLSLWRFRLSLRR
ncbi:MAG: hypothetical protein KJ892_03765 [Gammaproteobacteria bacterium]|nr:hypothetical protein [Gammaproteobacteria bacterium]